MLQQDNSVEMSTDDCEPTSSPHETSQLNSLNSESPANEDSEGMYADAVESMDERSPENSSATAEDDVSCESDVPSPEPYDLVWEMVDGEKAIAFGPEYIVYHDIYCKDSKVTFSTNCVQVSSSSACGNKHIFNIELAIDDVIDIQSMWSGMSGEAHVILSVIARDSIQDGSSGVEKLEFSVTDPCWHVKVSAILSLNVRYKDRWKVMLSSDLDRDQADMLLSVRYFPKFGESFEEVIYPQGDPDAVSISMRDVDLLKPDTFINDTIIDFYINFLKNKIPQGDRQRFHFFNCFFFRKLADMDKDPSSASEGRAAFLRVRKWTRRVNLFDKDFILIPVNYNYHWSLIVICHPGEIANIKGEDVETSDRVPCILHMDSLKGSHANLKNLIQSYLWEEWKERQKESVEDISSKFLNLRFVPLELPQQQNLYDCGLFLLHYVELFLEDAPMNFSPFKISKWSNFLTDRWFPTAEPSTKRGRIERLVYDLLKKHSQSSSCNSEKFHSNNPRIFNENKNALELTVEGLGPLKNDHEHVLNSDRGQGIEMDLLQPSSFRGSQCVNGSGSVLRELFEPTSSAALLLDVEYQAFGRTTSFNEFRSDLPPVEEEAEADMHLVQPKEADMHLVQPTEAGMHLVQPTEAGMHLVQPTEADMRFAQPTEAEMHHVQPTPAETGFQHLDVVPPDACTSQYAQDSYGLNAACDLKTSLEEKHNDIDSSSDKLTRDVENTSGVAENCPVGDAKSDDKINIPVPVEDKNCSRTQGCTPSETMEVLRPQSHIEMLDPSDSADPPTFLEELSEISHQKDANSAQDNNGVVHHRIEFVADDLASEEPEMQHAAKKIRLTCPSEAEREFSSTDLSNDLHL